MPAPWKVPLFMKRAKPRAVDLHALGVGLVEDDLAGGGGVEIDDAVGTIEPELAELHGSDAVPSLPARSLGLPMPREGW